MMRSRITWATRGTSGGVFATGCKTFERDQHIAVVVVVEIIDTYNGTFKGTTSILRSKSIEALYEPTILLVTDTILLLSLQAGAVMAR